MNSTFQKRRGEFNHDWLKNQYLTALGSWLNMLDGRIADSVLEQSFISEILPQWESAKETAESLACDFASNMSPRTLLNTSPLSRLDDPIKEWLGETVHQLWLHRLRVSEIVSRVFSEIGRTDQAYSNLKQALRILPSTESLETMRSLRREFSEFRACCESLAKAFEEFPSEVKAA